LTLDLISQQPTILQDLTCVLWMSEQLVKGMFDFRCTAKIERVDSFVLSFVFVFVFAYVDGSLYHFVLTLFIRNTIEAMLRLPDSFEKSK
jgi:hypothetical protein